MQAEEIRKYIDEMLDGSDVRILRIVYRILLGMK